MYADENLLEDKCVHALTLLQYKIFKTEILVNLFDYSRNRSIFEN